MVSFIETEDRYERYCEILEKLVFGEEAEDLQDEIELLTLLIEDWEVRTSPELDPVELVQSLMDDLGINQTELAVIAGVGKSYISEILNYKKKMSKKVIRNIASHFKIRQDALNRHYRVEGDMETESIAHLSIPVSRK